MEFLTGFFAGITACAWLWRRDKIAEILKKYIAYLKAKAAALKKLLPALLIVSLLSSCNVTKSKKTETSFEKDSASKVSDKQSLTTDALTKLLSISGLDLAVIYQGVPNPGAMTKPPNEFTGHENYDIDPGIYQHTPGDAIDNGIYRATQVDSAGYIFNGGAWERPKFQTTADIKKRFDKDVFQGGNIAAVYLHIDKVSDSIVSTAVVAHSEHDSSGKGKIVATASTEVKTSRPSWLAPLAGLGGVILVVLLVWGIVKLHKYLTVVALAAVFVFSSCSDRGRVLDTYNDTLYSKRDVPVFDTINVAGPGGGYILVRLPYNAPEPNWKVTYEPSSAWKGGYAWSRGDTQIAIGCVIIAALVFYFVLYKPGNKGDAKTGNVVATCAIGLLLLIAAGSVVDWARTNTTQTIDKPLYDSLSNRPGAMDSLMDARLKH